MAFDDSQAAMTDFMSEGGWTFPLMFDADPAAGAYKVRSIPTLFIIDGQGTIVKQIVGRVTAGDLAALVDDLTN